MENTTTCPTNVLESASAPGLMLLLATLIAGGIVLVICYAVNRRSRSRQDSQKTTYFDRNEFVPSSQPPMYTLPSTPVPMQSREFGNKRTKNKKRREVQQERGHAWMTGTLKGHTGLVNDIDFSSNGKYLASCADDENSRETRKHVQSSGQYHMYKKKESKKKGSSLQTDCNETQTTTRREDKEMGKASRSRSRGSSRFSYQHGTASEEPLLLEVLTSDTSSNDDIPEESQWQMMFPSDVPERYACLVSTLTRYTLSPKELFEHGYPVESTLFPGCAMINNVLYPSGPKIESDSGQYSNSSSSDNSEQESSSDNEKNFDMENSSDKEKSSDDKDRSEDKGRCDSESSSDNEKSLDDKSCENEKSCDSASSSDSEKSPDDRKSSGNEKSCDSESSSDSEKSSEHKKSCNRKSSSNDKNSFDDEMCSDEKRLDKRKSCDNESSSDSEKSADSKREFGVGDNTRLLERTCTRCEKIFYADENGEYLSMKRCVYHCGKLYNRMTNDSWYWTCCNQARFSRGCAEWKTHVWTGLIPGINGPLADYVQTMPAPMFLHNNYGVYAMDCEMCFTMQGLELARVTLVNLCGQVVYDTLVKPSSEIIDYNTKFSGITEEDMLNVTKTLPEVQNDLLNFVYAETILMGHGLGNDLRALHLIHKNVVDTSVMFPHYLGLPYRNGLKTLARRVLNRKIQEETHNSIEDALVVMDLVLRKAQYEWQESLVL